MRLMYIAPHLSSVGGLERTLTDKANYLVEHGNDVMLLTYAEPQTVVFYPLHPKVQVVSMNCPFHRLFRYPAYARPWRYFQIRRSFRTRMQKVVSDFMPDVVVVTIPNTEDFIYDMLEASGRAKVVIESHLASDYHLVNLSSTEKVIYHFNPPMGAIKKADLLITLTAMDAEKWRKRGLKYVMTVHNPLPAYTHELPDVEKLPGRIIAVGRLDEQKRFDRLIDAFSLIAGKHPSWYVDIFGRGKLHDDLAVQIHRQGLDGRVNLREPVKDIFTEYRRSQFFALSSDYEGFGLVIIEAMASGLPVVSTSCPCGPSEIIGDGVTGLLTKLDAADMAAKMDWMITHEHERQAMGQRAHKDAERYEKEKVIGQWIKAYQSVLP